MFQQASVAQLEEQRPSKAWVRGSNPFRRTILVGVAQLVRALDCDSRGREFETHHPPHIIYDFFLFFNIGVSPSGKARDFDSRMRWFESSHPSQFLRKQD